MSKKDEKIRKRIEEIKQQYKPAEAPLERRMAKERQKELKRKAIQDKIRREKGELEKLKQTRKAKQELERMKLQQKREEQQSRKELAELKKEIRQEQFAPVTETFEKLRAEMEQKKQPATMRSRKAKDMVAPLGADAMPSEKEKSVDITDFIGSFNGEEKTRSVDDWIGSFGENAKRSKIEDFI